VSEPVEPPPEPDPTTPPTPAPEPRGGRSDADQLRDALEKLAAARGLASRQDTELTKLKQAQLSASEKAIEKARGEGRQEALKAAGSRLAAAEFRAQAAGKIPDPQTLLDTMDLSRFVDDDGEPNAKLIGQVIEKLSAAISNGRPTAPSVPSGPRADPTDQDWLRQAVAGS
jgi:hypothetical protein